MLPFPPSAWQALTSEGVPRWYRTGEVLARQGDRGGHVLILLRGHVKVVRLEADGNELLLAVRGPGDLIGELAVLDDGERSATVSALTSCFTRIVSAERFRSIIREFGLYDMLIRHAIRRLKEGEDIRAELARLPAPALVARTLLRLATNLEVPLSQTDLAAATGLSRSAVAAELAALRRAEIITTARRRIVIQHPEALRAAASDKRPFLDSHRKD